MKWEVTAYSMVDSEKIPIGDSLVIRLSSEQNVSVHGYRHMGFEIRPVKQGEEDHYTKWELRLSLMEDENYDTLVGRKVFRYRTLAEATMDAEALLAYFQHTTASPAAADQSIPTYVPHVKASQWTCD